MHWRIQVGQLEKQTKSDAFLCEYLLENLELNDAKLMNRLDVSSHVASHYDVVLLHDDLCCE